MLSQEELVAFLGALESDRVERTESIGNADKFGQAICAFANDLPNHRQPGYLLIGVKDDGQLAGLAVSDELLRIQYLRLPGSNLTDVPEDQAEISGDLLSVLHELQGRTRLLIQRSLRPVGALQEKIVADYPEQAVRELLMNAVMHRNYDSNTPIRFYAFSDHIEIQSPGGLYGEATRENFPTRNSYRNPVIAEAMKTLGFVNRFGYGVQRAQALLVENGNSPAMFEFDEHAVLAKIYRRPA